MTKALEEYFHINMMEHKNFSFTFYHDDQLWSIEHHYLCNGLTMIKKINAVGTSSESTSRSEKFLVVDDPYELLTTLV